jgi:uncharacterized protein YdhG (YjbR/CyaY superfamily)
MPATKTTAKKPAPKKAPAKKANIWSDVERAAMQESARERKAAAKLNPAEERAAGEAEVRAKIEDMPPDERAMAERIHDLVTKAAPAFVPRTYYGMPAYSRDGKVICFLQTKSKFKVRYSTFGFQPDAVIDDGEMWPVAFAVTKLTPAAEARIVQLVKKAAS